MFRSITYSYPRHERWLWLRLQGHGPRRQQGLPVCFDLSRSIIFHLWRKLSFVIFHQNISQLPGKFRIKIENYWNFNAFIAGGCNEICVIRKAAVCCHPVNAPTSAPCPSAIRGEAAKDSSSGLLDETLSRFCVLSHHSDHRKSTQNEDRILLFPDLLIIHSSHYHIEKARAESRADVSKNSPLLISLALL